jgi:nucleoside-diphosphate-sugar epimerase
VDDSLGLGGAGAEGRPLVHRLDAAHLFRLALEKAPAGSVLYGVGQEVSPSAPSPRSSAAI